MFQNMGPAPTGRSGHAMATFQKKVLVIGGESYTSEKADDPSCIHVLDTSTSRTKDFDLAHSCSCRCDRAVWPSPYLTYNFSFLSQNQVPSRLATRSSASARPASLLRSSRSTSLATLASRSLPVADSDISLFRLDWHPRRQAQVVHPGRKRERLERSSSDRGRVAHARRFADRFDQARTQVVAWRGCGRRSSWRHRRCDAERLERSIVTASPAERSSDTTGSPRRRRSLPRRARALSDGQHARPRTSHAANQRRLGDFWRHGSRRCESAARCGRHGEPHGRVRVPSSAASFDARTARLASQPSRRRVLLPLAPATAAAAAAVCLAGRRACRARERRQDRAAREGEALARARGAEGAREGLCRARWCRGRRRCLEGRRCGRRDG